MSSRSYKLLAYIPALNISQTYALAPGRRYLLGSAAMEPDMLVFPADRSMSRRQAWLAIAGETLRVERHAQASQPLNGDAAFGSLELQSGDTFHVGLTTFEFRCSGDSEDDRAAEQVYPLAGSALAGALRRPATQKLLDLLNRLPVLMRENSTPESFLSAICQEIHLQIPGIQVTAWRLHQQEEQLEFRALGLEIVTAPGGQVSPPRPSRHLVNRALAAGAEECWVSAWHRQARESEAPVSLIATPAEWAMCIPLVLSEDERFVLYATGTAAMRDAERREAQRIFAALGTMAKQLLLTARVKERQGQIESFFSPLLRPLLLNASQETAAALAPGEFEATICYFDLRGSSRAAEESDPPARRANGSAASHFARLEKILGAATHMIFLTGGIVVDFQGDGILACWGVPPPGNPEQAIYQAFRAARQMIEIMSVQDWPEEASRLRCGIGLTHGKVLAGLFTAQYQRQGLLTKYTVIGSPVNQAARLESLTKQLGVPLLVDGAVAQALAGHNLAVRRIANVRPAGMRRTVQLYEAVLPRELGGTGIDREGVTAYEAALRLFEQGNFEAAAEAMRAVPRDAIELFLAEQITARRRHQASEDWEGVINLVGK